MHEHPAGDRILLADDDDFIRTAIAEQLRRGGYRVLEARNGREALDRAQHDVPAAAIIDIEMPEIGGLAVIERLRKTGNELPVLVLSGRVSVQERVQGLKSGADDYLAKPCSSEELLARVQALLRRSRGHHGQVRQLQLGDAHLDFSSRVATLDGKAVRLSRNEWAILELLARNLGRPVSRKVLLAEALGYTYLPSSRTVDTHIWRLRKKLGDTGKPPRWIKNVASTGYVLEHQLQDPTDFA